MSATESLTEKLEKGDLLCIFGFFSISSWNGYSVLSLAWAALSCKIGVVKKSNPIV